MTMYVPRQRHLCTVVSEPIKALTFCRVRWLDPIGTHACLLSDVVGQVHREHICTCGRERHDR
jgi:hypothetical protein